MPYISKRFRKHMDFRNFSGEDFAGNGFFVKWVKNPDTESTWFWESFIKEHPDKVEAIEEAKKIVSLLTFQEEKLSDEAILTLRNRILMAVHAEKEMAKDNPLMPSATTIRQRKVQWMRWAAVIGLPLLVAYVLSNRPRHAESSAPYDAGNVKSEKRSNPKGQKSVLLLADGTKVWLNADSRLNYGKDFGAGTTREVYLDGEAFFDVARNEAKPFVVHTSAISIKVLGTAFNVKSYTTDKTIETTLIHGKVSINKTDDAGQRQEALVLKPNERAIYNKKSNTVNVEHVLTGRTASWRFDKLIFDETPIADALAQLERWYDVTIYVENRDSLTCGLTADIENEKLEDILKLLETTHHISYTISEKEVFIKGILCR